MSEGWKKNIADLFSLQKPKAEYTYDFGDDWLHIVMREEMLPKGRCVRGCLRSPLILLASPAGFEPALPP